LPRFIPPTTAWVYADPVLTVAIDFPEAMDQTAQPLPGDFVLTVDDVVKPIASLSWISALTMTLLYSEAVLGPTVVKLRFSTKSPLFRSVLGEIVTPFDLVITAP